MEDTNLLSEVIALYFVTLDIFDYITTIRDLNNSGQIPSLIFIVTSTVLSHDDFFRCEIDPYSWNATEDVGNDVNGKT